MKARFEIGALLWAAVIGMALPAGAQTAAAPSSPMSSEQQEADYRVIAARCGTPAFEKAFFKQSTAVVAAGLVSKHRSPAEVEKAITALRRSPLVLVAAPSDCPAQLAQLAQLQKSRSALIRPARGRMAQGK